MKTILLSAVLLTAAAPVCAYRSAELHGEWQCNTAYPDIGAETRDRIRFAADGKVDVQSNILFRFGNHTFGYRLPSVGTWQFESRLLTLQLTDGKLQRDHDETTRRALVENPALRTYDLISVKVLSSRQPGEQFFLRIDKLDGRIMKQTQLASADGQEMAKTVCTRVMV
ncbi:MAG: hypothetical protein Q4A49_02475 [Neisseria sp.]|nr:hypothetical protein [Neisseria sp.]